MSNVFQIEYGPLKCQINIDLKKSWTIRDVSDWGYIPCFIELTVDKQSLLIVAV